MKGLTGVTADSPDQSEKAQLSCQEVAERVRSVTGATVPSPTWGSARCRWDTSAVDVLAVTSVIVAGVAAASTGINAFYNTRRTAKTAKEGRAQQRAADGYLKVLSLAEQEAQWLDSLVHNYGLDRKELEYGVVSFLQVPKPAVTERATAAALIAAFASEPVDSGGCPGARRCLLEVSSYCDHERLLRTVATCRPR